MLWLACFFAGLSLSQITPFLPTYVKVLGVDGESDIQIWSGLVFGITFLVSAICAPLWGRVADRRGRKLMLLRASLGMAVVVFLQAFVRDVWELLILRIAMGITSGFGPNAAALMSRQAPVDKTARTLGLLATASTMGVILGPLSGGLMIDLLGLQAVFLVTAAVMLVSFAITFVAVREAPMLPSTPSAKRPGLFGPHLLIKGVPALLYASLVAQFLNGSTLPVLIPLVQSFTGENAYSAFLGGLIYAAPGLSALLCAPWMGALADRMGPVPVLVFSMGGCALVFAATGYASTPMQLGGLRLLLGVAECGLMPCIQTLLVRRARRDNLGAILGFNQSFSYLGNVIGPLLSGVVFSCFGHVAFFLCIGCLAMGSAIFLCWSLYEELLR
ncbi:MFS transporter [Pseudomonas sp. LRF_L74]|uniref:MFS transporter n=1 Tax=Pseudomonas sp. LRF_L74 TaxID=3369422 RepID=UPI003F5E11D0